MTRFELVTRIAAAVPLVFDLSLDVDAHTASMGAGVGLSNHWRWTRRRGARRPYRRAKLPPLDR
ncbi:hypothetical protein ACFC63_19675 [Streptomyces albidoflavus]